MCTEFFFGCAKENTVNFGPAEGPKFCEMLTDQGSFSRKYIIAMHSQHIHILCMLRLFSPQPTFR